MSVGGGGPAIGSWTVTRAGAHRRIRGISSPDDHDRPGPDRAAPISHVRGAGAGGRQPRIRRRIISASAIERGGAAAVPAEHDHGVIAAGPDRGVVIARGRRRGQRSRGPGIGRRVIPASGVGGGGSAQVAPPNDHLRAGPDRGMPIPPDRSAGGADRYPGVRTHHPGIACRSGIGIANRVRSPDLEDMAGVGKPGVSLGGCAHGPAPAVQVAFKSAGRLGAAKAETGVFRGAWIGWVRGDGGIRRSPVNGPRITRRSGVRVSRRVNRADLESMGALGQTAITSRRSAGAPDPGVHLALKGAGCFRAMEGEGRVRESGRVGRVGVNDCVRRGGVNGPGIAGWGGIGITRWVCRSDLESMAARG